MDFNKNALLEQIDPQRKAQAGQALGQQFAGAGGALGGVVNNLAGKFQMPGQPGGSAMSPAPTRIAEAPQRSPEEQANISRATEILNSGKRLDDPSVNFNVRFAPDGSQFVAGGQPGAQRQNASIGSVMPLLREKYKHTPDDLKRAFAENPDAFAGAEIMGSKGDKIRFADGRIYDVIQAAGEGGKAWQELWDNNPNAAPAPMAMGGGGNPALAQAQGGLDALLQGDPMAKIQQALAGFSQGNRPNMEALLQQLQG